jgi:hypothetical protein
MISLRHASMGPLTWASPQHGSVWQDFSMQMGTHGFSQIRDSSVTLQSAKMGITSESQLPMAEFLPSKSQDEQSVSSEFFDDGDLDGTKPQSNVNQPSQESRINPRRD